MLSFWLRLCIWDACGKGGSVWSGGRVRASLTLGRRAWSPAQGHLCLPLILLSTGLARVTVSERLSLEIYAFG